MPRAVSLLSRAALAAWLAFAGELHAGIPEPDLVWYGAVLANSNDGAVRVTAGTLTWEIEPQTGGAPWVVSTSLTNIHDQFSFVLRVPCESPEPGIPSTSETVVLAKQPISYRRVKVTLDGQPLAISRGGAEFTPGLMDRGRSERIDLVLGTALADTDDDGMADSWEQQYFGNLNATPDADADGDGVTNLQEYRSGTDPKDPQSLFVLLEISAGPQGVQLLWSSQPNRTYRVLRSATLLASAAAFELVKTGLAATPPVNEFLDTSALNGAQFFYLIQTEN